MSSLDTRFDQFARQIPGAEPIDELPLTFTQRSAKKADFFFDERRLICEIKSLETDTKNKIEGMLAPYRGSPEWPVYYGEWDLHKVLARLPDGERLQREIFDAVTSAVPNLMRDANRQIRDSRSAFNLPNADGILVILNDLVGILSPDVLAYAVATGLRKRKGGQTRFSCLNMVWMVNEAHAVQLAPDLKAKLAVVLKSSSVPPSPAAEAFVASLLSMWASRNGRPMIDLSERPLFELDFKDLAATKPAGQMTRDEAWRSEYHERPHLRPLSKEELLQHGHNLVGQLAPAYLKGGPSYTGEDDLALLKQWAGFLEEVSFRAIDLREYAPRITAGLKKQFGQFGEKIKATEAQGESA